jgi:hypothetical protein
MSAYAIIGLIFAAWTMLNLLGSERQRELIAIRTKQTNDQEIAGAPPAPDQPAAPKSAKVH